MDMHIHSCISERVNPALGEPEEGAKDGGCPDFLESSWSEDEQLATTVKGVWNPVSRKDLLEGRLKESSQNMEE